MTVRDRVRTRKCQSSGASHTDRIAAAVSTAAWQIQANPDQKDAILDSAITRFEDESQAILKLVNR